MNKIPEAVLITAGTRRIGFCMARAALDAGFSVILHYRSSKQQASSWLKHHPEFSNKVFFIQHDLSETPEKLIQKATELPCTLIGLVNNASVFSPGNLLDNSHLDQMLNIHFRIPAQLGAAFAQQVKRGWIINITDAKIQPPNPTYQNYRMSKLFLEELTRQQAFLFAPRIRVNAIAPGAILPSTDETKTTFAKLRTKIPLQKTGTAQMVANAFRFLIDNDYCTGQTLAIDGGWHLTGC